MSDSILSSPADWAWSLLLRGYLTGTKATHLQRLIGSEDSYDLELNPIHRIILGMSSADLKDQIELDPPKVNGVAWTGMSPLMWAAMQANHTALALLLDHHAQVDMRDRQGRSALHFAMLAGSYDCTRSLLEAGADSKQVDRYGRTPLHIVAMTVRRFDMGQFLVSILLEYGAEIEARDIYGHTPLLRATRDDDGVVIEALLDHGADINTLVSYGDTPLGVAIALNSQHALKVLIDRGASLTWKTKSDTESDAFQIAAAYGAADTMYILATSTAARVDYDLAEIMYHFNNWRDEERIYGTCPFSRDEDLEALMFLLEKKGRRIDPRTGKPWAEQQQASGYVVGEDDEYDEDDEDEEDEDDDLDKSEDDELDEFEDAVEEHIEEDQTQDTDGGDDGNTMAA